MNKILVDWEVFTGTKDNYERFIVEGSTEDEARDNFIKSCKYCTSRYVPFLIRKKYVGYDED